MGDADVLRGIHGVRIRLCVFDLDGTLVDSLRDLADSANALLVECGAQPLDEAAVAGTKEAALEAPSVMAGSEGRAVRTRAAIGSETHGSSFLPGRGRGDSLPADCTERRGFRKIVKELLPGHPFLHSDWGQLP